METTRKSKQVSRYGGGPALDRGTCRTCGDDIAWAKSKRTGKSYPCTVQLVRTMTGSDIDYEAAIPWAPHKCYGGRERVEQEIASHVKLLAEQQEAFDGWAEIIDLADSLGQDKQAAHYRNLRDNNARMIAETEGWVTFWQDRLDKLTAAGR